jgi:chorismate dehydratase
MLYSGEIEAAPVSTFATFVQPLEICPGICISSEGPVGSVLAFSRVPFEDVRTVALDGSSLSGASLLRIVLRERFGVDPECRRTMPQSVDEMLLDADAALLIGDAAMQADLAGLYTLDMAEEWKRLTGLPAVFAVWAGRTITPELECLLSEAKEEGLGHLEEICVGQSQQLGLTYERCLDYLSNVISFDLGEREMESVELFRKKAQEHNLIEEAELLWTQRAR